MWKSAHAEKLTAAALALVMYMPRLFSQEEADTFSGDPLTVYGRRSASEESDGTGSATVIRPDETNSRSRNIPQLLGELAGVQVKEYGNRSRIYVRGADAHQIKVYINGVPADDPAFGLTDLSAIPVEQVERIELYRSHAPIPFQSPGIGGVVNIVTRSVVPYRRISAGYGSFDTRTFSFSSVEQIGQVTSSFAVSMRSAENDYEYVNDNGTPVVNTADDFTDKRRNNSERSLALSQSFRIPFAGGYLNVADSLSYARRGVPGTDTIQNRKSSVFEWDNRLTGECVWNDIGGDNRFAVRSFYTVRNESYSDPDSEIFTSYESLENSYASTGVSLVPESAFLAGRNRLGMNLSWRRDTYGRTVRKTGETEHSMPEQYRNVFEGAIEDTLAFSDERGLLVVQGRYVIAADDYYDMHRYSLMAEEKRKREYTREYGYTAGIRYYLLPDTLFLRTSLSRSYRLPHFSELFGTDASTRGNSELVPEVSHTVDVGAGLRTGTRELFLDVTETVFHSHVDDVILYVPNSQLTVIPLNAGDAVIRGSETAVRLDALGYAALGGCYTYQEARDSSGIPYYDGNYLPYRPLHEADVFAELYTNFLRLTYSLDYTGFTFRDRANAEFYYVDYRVRHDIHLSLRSRQGVSLHLEANNVTDEKSCDVTGYPLPGRAFHGEISYRY